MKKALSLILAAAMMAIGFAAMATTASAAEPAPDLEIKTVDQWNAFATGDAARQHDKKLVKITADLDFTGKEFKPIPDAVCIIDGGGHTFKGINVKVDNATAGEYGIVANKLSNFNFNGYLTNLKVADSSITVNIKDGETNPVYVGGVVGRIDRAHVTNVTVENVTVKVTGGTVKTDETTGAKSSNVYASPVVGGKDWGTGNYNKDEGFESYNVGDVAKMDNITITNCTVDAANATTGIVMGTMSSDPKASVSKLTVSGLKVTSLNEVKADTLVGKLDKAENFTAGTGNNVKLEAAADPGKTPEQPPKTGSASVVIAAVAVIALAGAVVATRKREQD